MTHSTTQKHLGMLLGVKPDFQGHLKNIYRTINKIIGLSLKLQNNIPRLPLLRIYISFIIPYLDYDDISTNKLFRNFSSRTQVYRARKRKAKISV